LKEDKPEEPIRYATFDHRLKDPSDSGACVRPSDRIVIIEGLYTLLDRPGWKECAQQMDIRVWIEVDACVAQQRVIARNLEAGICDTLEACTARGECNERRIVSKSSHCGRHGERRRSAETPSSSHRYRLFRRYANTSSPAHNGPIFSHAAQCATGNFEVTMMHLYFTIADWLFPLSLLIP